MQDALDAQVQALDARAESLETVAVTLDAEQWQFLADELRMQAAFGLLSLLMLCACFGAIVAGYFVDGWRR